MIGDTPDRQLAVLDTSFWTIGYRAEVVANCLDLFEIVVPHAVEAEIRAVQEDVPRREYPYATLFRHLRGQMLDPPTDAPSPLSRFGAGEAEAIPLAQHLNARLLVNERPATTYARSLGIRITSVTTVILTLWLQGVISTRAARRKLDLIAGNTAPDIIAQARTVIGRTASSRAPGSDRA
jgi:predicted nucleic acid-binding protein